MIRWMPILVAVVAIPLTSGVASAQGPAPVPQHHGEAYQPLAGSPAGLPPVQPGYPYLNAPLYPTPQPNVPVQVGSTLVTNQAFYPQEM